MAKEDIIRKGRDIREVAPKKRIVVSSEITYILAVVLLALAVAILTAADLGISMIVAPAYLLSLKTGVVTFGQAEYIIQAGVFILLCLVIRRFRPVYLMSFVTCLVYGAVLDLWRMLPCFDPSVTARGAGSRDAAANTFAEKHGHCGWRKAGAPQRGGLPVRVSTTKAEGRPMYGRCPCKAKAPSAAILAHRRPNENPAPCKIVLSFCGRAWYNKM